MSREQQSSSRVPQARPLSKITLVQLALWLHVTRDFEFPMLQESALCPPNSTIVGHPSQVARCLVPGCDLCIGGRVFDFEGANVSYS